MKTYLSLFFFTKVKKLKKNRLSLSIPFPGIDSTRQKYVFLDILFLLLQNKLKRLSLTSIFAKSNIGE